MNDFSIGIIYESEEWSNLFLRDYIQSKGYNVAFLNFEKNALQPKDFKNIKLLVNRLFPSSFFRGNVKSYNRSFNLLNDLNMQGIQMINSFQAYKYDFDKTLVNSELISNNINSPKIYCSSRNLDLSKIKFPCILKPNCGGRSNYTYLINNIGELEKICKKLPPIDFIYQEYINSIDNYTLRVEIIDNKITSIMKRSIDSTGISSYHRAAKYKKFIEINDELENMSLKTMKLLDIKMGSLDIIQNESGYYVIDVNATSNFSKDFLETLGYNPLELMGNLIIDEYHKII